jgi:hypothetical protein
MADAAQPDDPDARRQRGQELRALQWLGLLRQYFEPAMDMTLPVLGRPPERTSREASQFAQAQGQEPAGPQGRRQGWQQAAGPAGVLSG